MKSGYLILFLTLLLLVASDVFGLGVGLRWNQEVAVIKFGELKCIDYGAYNPFGEDSAISLKTTGNITEIITIIEPPEVLVPAGTSSGDSVTVRLCVYGKYGKFPYKPATYSGEVLAAITGSRVGGSGSAVGASVAAPLEIKVGDLSLYNRIKNTAIAITVIVVGSISFRTFRRYRRKKWESTIRNECPTCKKTLPFDTKFCPDDGTALVKYKGDERIEISENRP